MISLKKLLNVENIIDIIKFQIHLKFVYLLEIFIFI